MEWGNLEYNVNGRKYGHYIKTDTQRASGNKGVVKEKMSDIIGAMIYIQLVIITFFGVGLLPELFK